MSTEFATGLPSERARHILRALVEQYIQDGQPVGSRTLARRVGLELSPATIRNVMADLEEQGFISAPHTSAGRVPRYQRVRGVTRWVWWRWSIRRAASGRRR